MRHSDKERIQRKARTIRALMSGLGLFVGTAAYAQDGGVPPAPPVAGDPAQTVPAEPLPEAGAAPNGSTGACTCEDCQCAVEEEAVECDLLMRCFDDDCGNNWLADNGFQIYGFLDQGYTWNPDYPVNNINGPVTFNDRANEYQMNQLYLIFERAVDPSADEWQLGGRVDLLYGTDYFFTQALGLELEQDGTQRWNPEDDTNRANGASGNLYGLAMPQLYAEIAGNDLSVRIGHFYTIIGYEVVPATGNFFYSHAYTMQYGEPFTHTGVLAAYDIAEGVTLSSGVVQGWDNWDNTNPGVSYLSGIALTNADATTSLAFSVITGEEPVFNVTDPVPPDTVPTTTRFFDNRTMYSVVLTQMLTDRLTYVFQHDLGWQDRAGGFAGPDAEWYGVNQYLFYDVNDNVRAGLRGEWFRDEDGFRLANGSTNYYQVTGGLNITLADCLLLRPEVRYDWADDATPYDDFTEDDQFLFATDLIWSF